MNKMLCFFAFLSLFACALSQEAVQAVILVPTPVLVDSEGSLESEINEWLLNEEFTLAEGELAWLNEDLNILGEAIEAINEAFLEAFNELVDEGILGEEDVLAEILVIDVPVPVVLEEQNNGQQ